MTRGAPIWVVINDAEATARIKAPDARALIVECGGRARWLATERVWLTSAAVGADILALAAERHRRVVFGAVRPS